MFDGNAVAMHLQKFWILSVASNVSMPLDFFALVEVFFIISDESMFRLPLNGVFGGLLTPSWHWNDVSSDLLTPSWHWNGVLGDILAPS